MDCIRRVLSLRMPQKKPCEKSCTFSSWTCWCLTCLSPPLYSNHKHHDLTLLCGNSDAPAPAAAAAPAAGGDAKKDAPAAKKKEPEPEAEEDMGFSLFD
jgi:hypothetical protein